MVRADKTKAVRIIDHFVLGGFLVCENPFSAAHQLQLRVRFNALDSRVSQAWSRTVMAMPGAIIAALAAGPIYRGVGLPHDAILPMVRLAASFPFLVLAFGIAIGVPASWKRRGLQQEAARLEMRKRSRN